MELVLFPPGVGSKGKEGRTRASGAEAAYFRTKEARAAGEQARGNLWFSRLLTDAGLPSPSLSPTVHSLLFPAGGRSLPLYGLAGGLLNE